MTYVVRMIRGSRWDTESDPNAVSALKVPPEPLADFAESTLSVWLCDDLSLELDRLLAAFAAMRAKLDKLDCVIFQAKVLEELKLVIAEKPGATFDEAVNLTHRNLVGLSARDVLELTEKVYRERLLIQRRDQSEIRSLIAVAVNDRRFEIDRLSPKIRDAIKEDVARLSQSESEVPPEGINYQTDV